MPGYAAEATDPGQNQIPSRSSILKMGGVAAEGAGDEDEDFLILTPGVGLDSKGDTMGQQYRTPREVVFESGCDVIIVGRGIYGKGGDEEVRAQAERYRKEGWAAYEERVRG